VKDRDITARVGTFGMRNKESVLNNRPMHLTEVISIYSIGGYGKLPTEFYGI
jgi:hypothetical protein